jgi:hypothetical protein
LNEDGNWTVVWENQHINSTLNPRWAVVTIAMAALCNGDVDRPLRIDIYGMLLATSSVITSQLTSWLDSTVDERSGKHVFMRCVETSVRQMISLNGRPMDVIEPEKRNKKKKYVNSGVLCAVQPSIEHNPTLGDVNNCPLSRCLY